MTATRKGPATKLVRRDGLLGPREIARRTRALRASVGRQLLDQREEAAITRSQLADAAGVDPAYLWKIETGHANPSLGVLVALAAQLGSDLGVRLFPTIGPRLYDRFQAPMIDGLIRVLDRRWIAEPECPVPAVRGVIDLVLREPGYGTVLACECHSELRRLELAIRRLNEKTTALRDPEGTGREVSSLLLLRSTSATRQIARLYQATLAAAFPARTTDAVAALTGNAPWPRPAIVWMEVAAGRARLLDGPPRSVRLGR
jgi:transcriptional regulator with XRE-family HTH domain